MHRDRQRQRQTDRQTDRDNPLYRYFMRWHHHQFNAHVLPRLIEAASQRHITVDNHFSDLVTIRQSSIHGNVGASSWQLVKNTSLRGWMASAREYYCQNMFLCQKEHGWNISWIEKHLKISNRDNLVDVTSLWCWEAVRFSPRSRLITGPLVMFKKNWWHADCRRNKTFLYQASKNKGKWNSKWNC